MFFLVFQHMSDMRCQMSKYAFRVLVQPRKHNNCEVSFFFCMTGLMLSFFFKNMIKKSPYNTAACLRHTSVLLHS